MPQKEHIKRSFLKKTAVALIGLAAFCLLAFFALSSIYMQSYTRDKIESLLKHGLNREVSIEGPVHINWHWFVPRIYAEKIHIANLAGSKDPYLLNIEKIDFAPRVWELLRGRLEISDMYVFHPQLFLEKRAAGIKNWDSSSFSGVASVKKVADAQGGFPPIGSLRVREGKISYKDNTYGLTMMLNLNTVAGKGLPSDEGFVLEGDGTLENKKFKLKAAGGALKLLLDTQREFPFSFEITERKSTFSVEGTLTDPAQLRGMNATLRLEGSNLADLFYFMHIPFPPTPSYKLEGQLKKDSDYWTFNQFAGKVGHSDLSGKLLYNTKGERPLLSGDLFSTRLDVADLGGLIGLSPGVPGKIAKSGGVLPDMKLDLKRLRAGDMDLNLTAEKLNAPGWPLSDMQTHITLKDGLFVLKPLQFGAADGIIKGFLQLDGRKEVPQVKMDLALKKLSLKRFFTGAAFNDFSQGFFNGQIQIQGPGYSLAQALGNSNGHIVFNVVGGKISKSLIESANLGITELLPLLGTDKTTDIRCGIGDFNVSDGQLKSKVFMLDTTDTRLEGKADVNLKKETINASFHAYPKDLKLLSLQPKILISGKMGSPSVTIDTTSAGAKVVGATLLSGLFPGAVLLPFIEPGGGETATCDQLISQARIPEVEQKGKVKGKNKRKKIR